jgi:hypothetical protein
MSAYALRHARQAPPSGAGNPQDQAQHEARLLQHHESEVQGRALAAGARAAQLTSRPTRAAGPTSR